MGAINHGKAKLNGIDLIPLTSIFYIYYLDVRINDHTGDIVVAGGPLLFLLSVNGDCIAYIDTSLHRGSQLPGKKR